MRPPLFILLRGAYCTIKPAILLLRDRRKLLKHSPARFLCVFPSPSCARKHHRSTFPEKINLFPRLSWKEKHSSFGPASSVVTLASASHNESLKCERLKMQKHRRRPDTCHPFHPEVLLSLTHMCTCLLLCSIQTYPVCFSPPSRRTRWSAEEPYVSSLLPRRCCSASSFFSTGDQSWPRLPINTSTWIGFVQHAKVKNEKKKITHTHTKKKNKQAEKLLANYAQFQVTACKAPPWRYRTSFQHTGFLKIDNKIALKLLVVVMVL